MLRSMFAGVSGLRSHQTMMDVTGNNIANVNTFGYKSSRATFQDALYQTVRGATGATAAAGGTNPTQIGLGARVASIDGVFSQGALQLTNRATDVSIQGEGFFVTDGPQGMRYTRAGTFGFDDTGNLVGPNGEFVQGVSGANPPTNADLVAPTAVGGLQAITVPPAVMADLRDISFGADGHITARDGTGAEVKIGRLATATFVNTNGLTRTGESSFAQSGNSGDPQIGAPNEAGRGSLSGGTLEMSNVDLAQEFTQLIMSQRGYQANARTITTSDELLQELINIKR